jgi:hypothetical protein
MGEQKSAPGWYPVRGGQRYWDGDAWTDHIAPAVQVVGPNPYRTNHVLHLLLTVLTVGLWAPVWALVALVNRQNARQWASQHGAPR